MFIHYPNHPQCVVITGHAWGSGHQLSHLKCILVYILLIQIIRTKYAEGCCETCQFISKDFKYYMTLELVDESNHRCK